MASIEINSVAVSAQGLSRAGRWQLATALLDAIEPADAREAGALAVARAEVEVDYAFWMRRDADPELVAAARELAADAIQVWTAEFAQVRAAYAPLLRARIAGEALERAAVGTLATTAERLAETAPDSTDQAYATFYRGLIASVLQDDSVAGDKHYRAAAETDDEYVRSYALRHVGSLADDAGRHDEAIELWRESTRLRQRAGFVPGALAQLQLITAHTSAERVVAEWADELGIGAWIVQTAAIAPDDEVA